MFFNDPSWTKWISFLFLFSCFAGFLSLDGTFITLSPLARWSSLGKLSFFFSLSVGKNKNSKEEWCQGRWAENGKVRYGDEARREWFYANFNVKQLARLCSVAMVSERVTDNMTTTGNFEEIQIVGGHKFIISCIFSIAFHFSYRKLTCELRIANSR